MVSLIRRLDLSSSYVDAENSLPVLPLTADNLVSVMEAVRPEAVHCVPYALGLLAEKQRGIEALKACQVVTAAGARTPDELGDRLVKAGINLGVIFGT